MKNPVPVMAHNPWTFIKTRLLALAGNRQVLAWLSAFFICLVVVLIYGSSNRNFKGKTDEFEVGKVAERDVIAEYQINYQDEKATRLRMEAMEQLVPAVFQYSSQVSEELLNRWNNFSLFAENLSRQADSPEVFVPALQSEFPGDFSDDVLEQLFNSGEQNVLFENCSSILNALLDEGIYSMPEAGLERLNPGVIELTRHVGTRTEIERIPFWNIINVNEAGSAVEENISAGSFPLITILLAPHLLKPFLLANVFYSEDETAKRILEARSAVEPVMVSIEQGKKIIRKGFVVTEEDMEEFNALRMSQPENNLPAGFANLLFLLLLFGLLMFFSGRRIIGREITDRETYLVSGLASLYIAGSILAKSLEVQPMPVSVVFPTALVIILPSILIHSRLALMLAMALPLGSFLTGSFDTPSYIFALVSGVVAAYSLQGAEKRMDLVKAGLIIAAANLIAMAAVLLWQNAPFGVYPYSLFWAAFNGVASGMLVLGILPPLESALNAATAFRLIELSDLNAPVLKRLFTIAPGTYSHSIMVANLAEAACQDIRANSILARVGAYYHDLGKMETPGYFVENQTEGNPHDGMVPRLSATVIRSHVNLGIEKARKLGLPREVIDIIGEHHGNSLITWFYSKAMKQEYSKNGSVNIDDFCYLGNPPRSRESAVVMLADVSEAAVRTLNKPTAAKVEKFVQELISKKVEQGQLAQSELTFRDLETIKNAFVRVLMAYYHSRIEYPKIEAQTVKELSASETNKALRA